MPTLIRHLSKPDFTLEVIPDSVEGGSGFIHCWSDAHSAKDTVAPQNHTLTPWSAGHGETWEKRVDVTRPAFLRASQKKSDGSLTWSKPVLVIIEIRR
jgi:hypothetical protein